MIKQYAELTETQKSQARAKFSATPLTSKSFTDYVYEICGSGSVISRKSRAEFERDTAVLMKPQPKGVRLDGWDI